jgi:2-polyprenyl-3-methyl-5-hydroxy-6-metoxy-1,4-benzoquinol methylase
MLAMNPYRQLFYQRQAAWHANSDLAAIQAHHRQRDPYYAWFTRNWLPSPASAPRILDVGCGAGQFLHFLRGAGFTNCQGIDCDATQVDYARRLGLDCRAADALSFLAQDTGSYDLITMLDVLEHLRYEELAELLALVTAHLSPSGAVILSVPNASSPNGFTVRYGDITHELAFTPTSVAEMLFCHGLKPAAFRDPYPAPVTPLRAVYRAVATVFRLAESLRIRALGLAPPRYWSPVIWVLAKRV